MKRRSKFSLGHTVLFSCDGGELIPFGAVEVLPGDTFQHSTAVLVRASPLLAPVYHPVHIRIHHFYVPYRLIWDDFEKFITGGPDGNDMSEYPTVSLSTINEGTLADYLGLPPGTYADPLEVSALPFRAYNLIYREYYRDQDLQPEPTIDTSSGPDTTTWNSLFRVGWEKDYFTSARPWEQKGPAITIPLGETAPVVRTSNAPGWMVYQAGTNSVAATGDIQTGGTGNLFRDLGPTNVSLDPVTGLETDLTGASAITINTLREAFALQRFEEARARFGSRYTEYLRYLGVRSSDSRLQRPEYLGGGRQTIQFSEVLQTAEGDSPVGELRGHGIGAMRSNRYRRFFEEHGIVLSLFSIRPKTMYPQGVNRFWNRRTKEDFWQRELEHIGQQAVLNKEVYAMQSAANRDATFGFQDRYDEYRRMESRVSGEFRSVLSFWHFARQFGTAPALNGDFVQCIPTEEPFAVPSQDVYYINARHSIQARRLLSSTGRSFIF